MLTIFCDDESIRLTFEGTALSQFPMSLRHVYNMEPLIAECQRSGILSDGLSLKFQGPCQDAHVGMRLELIMQLQELSATYYTYPKLSEKSPHRPENSREDFEHHLHSIENLEVYGSLCNCPVLAGYAKGLPVVLVAPGPSFDGELLRRLKGKAIIVAVGRVLPRLLAHDVIPDFLYVQETTASGWEEIFRGVSGPPLPTVLVANPVGPIARYRHLVKHVYKSWNYYDFEKDKMEAIESIAPSSTTGAYSFALLLGARDLYFMGCDCGSLQTESHSLPYAWPLQEMARQGSVPDVVFTTLGQLILPTEEGSVLTKSDYVASLQWLKRHIMRDVPRGVNFYDNSATGLLRYHGITQPYPAHIEYAEYGKRPLPLYNPHFDVTSHRKLLESRYLYLKRHFQRHNTIPSVALMPPYNCIFKDIDRFSGVTLELTAEEVALVASRLERLVLAMQGTS